MVCVLAIPTRDCSVQTSVTMRNHLEYLKSKIRSLQLIFSICLIAVFFNSSAKSSTFSDNFYSLWGNVKLEDAGETAQLTLDKTSGSGFASKSPYLFGVVSMKIKLAPGNTAGIVAAYYMSSETSSSRDEIDFEFLGNVAGKPYILQTNVFAKGTGNREERIHLWFDPSANFHNYSILWNHKQIVFSVDSITIRVFRNYEDAGVPYPNSQPMRILSTLWDGSDWATDGGKVKIDWGNAPFVTAYRGFEVDACIAFNNSSPACAEPGTGWWDQSQFHSLSQDQLRKLKWVRQKYRTYNYCTDKQRFSTTPPECSLTT